jgi:hypothetical protein
MRPASLRKLHRAVDRHTAERVSIQPMQAGGYLVGSPLGDPVEVLAVMTETSGATRTAGEGANSGHAAELLGATHTAKFTTSALPFGATAGFVLTRLDRPDTPSFRISGVYPFGSDRTILTLVKVAL